MFQYGTLLRTRNKNLDLFDSTIFAGEHHIHYCYSYVKIDNEHRDLAGDLNFDSCPIKFPTTTGRNDNHLRCRYRLNDRSLCPLQFVLLDITNNHNVGKQYEWLRVMPVMGSNPVRFRFCFVDGAGPMAKLACRPCTGIDLCSGMVQCTMLPGMFLCRDNENRQSTFQNVQLCNVSCTSCKPEGVGEYEVTSHARGQVTSRHCKGSETIPKFLWIAGFTSK
jgi:hypothetical protein